MPEQDRPEQGPQHASRRVTLRPLLDFGAGEWRTLHSFFRDRELADWNDAKPIKMPEWLFRRVMQDEEKTGERAGFGVLDEHGTLIGSAELYDLRPHPPSIPTVATLGVMIGVQALWGQGYGREAVAALLRWAFEERSIPLSRVRLTTFGHNRRAQRAFLACGFREIGRSERPERTDVHMEITRPEWLNLPDNLPLPE
ncbi:GNAT family N-acetyltransferase [Deinococcus sp. QL22]|uniref:GNAT family N-acetyltransferase n=1 Tax=Deinococcus sp. QL22 TaxID=2939437 RepID=UPI0020176D98|nr:GNAT family N-acetyltransferase [Deinococcus sp. QL22]UQN06847.1 GNAT family N-acetyltransferase [Deinococcus sp. QL22]